MTIIQVRPAAVVTDQRNKANSNFRHADDK